MAAMELAPSKRQTTLIPETPVEDATNNEEIAVDESNSSEDMVRIKIIQSLPDPIMLGDNIEITLEVGDIHFIDKDTAEWLVESGVAEVENL